MACGCKNKKKNKPVVGRRAPLLVEDQKDYRKRVSEAMRQFMDIKKRKQNLKK